MILMYVHVSVCYSSGSETVIGRILEFHVQNTYENAEIYFFLGWACPTIFLYPRHTKYAMGV